MLVDFYRRRMCQSSSFVPSWEASGPTSSSSAVIPKEITNVVQGVMHLPYRKRKPVVVALLSIVITTAVLFATLYAFNPGFRRTCQFWSSVTPVAIEYRFIKFKSKYIDKVDDDELKRRINSFHKRTAPKMVAMVQYLGGIYVKIGQMLATIGAGFLDDEYLRALRPLQDGVSPRSKQQVFEIIERSTGKKMEDMFESFDETPIGAASIGQAHRATLRPSTTTVSSNDGVDRYGDAADVGNEVVVKVQYPEVASLFNVDFNNLELVTRWINPENLDFVKKIRQRHENELDFTIEAENLRECTRNMQAHGVEPRLVRVPRVRNETGICTQHVLVMEYLRGVSLADAIEREQNAIAQALGGKDASEFRTEMIKRMKDHFERGGGADDGGKIGMVTNEKKMRLVSLAGPLALKVLRAYAVSRDAVLDTLHKMDQAFQTVVRLPNNDNLSSGSKQDRKKPRINMARALKTLVHVHGLQMIKDGVYNADPHPVSSDL
jgi:aarF domain-containing kinase